MKQNKRFTIGGRIGFSLLLIGYGTLLLLHNFEILEMQSVWRSWPLIFVAIGLYKLAQAESITQIGPGAWWLFLGSWLHVSFNHVWGLSFRDTWPLIIIAWGVGILWEAYMKQLKRKPVSERLAQENGYGE